MLRVFLYKNKKVLVKNLKKIVIFIHKKMESE